jgi:hypothetical protein
MDKTGAYEFAGIIAPGAVTIFGLSRIYPEIGLLIQDNKISFGEFGLLLILAYVIGHLIQTLGNLVETVWWGCWRGWPSDWPRSHAHSLLAPQQLSILPAKIRAALNLDCPDDVSTLDRKHWFSITRQIYAAVKKAGQAERIDVFNATYGLFRGTVSALIVIAAAAIFGKSSQALLLSIGCLVGIGLGFFRMHRFGVHYARELFVQFLSISPERTGISEEANQNEL